MLLTTMTQKTNTNFKSKSDQVAELKNRVEAAYPFLPRNYKKIIVTRFPDYNSIEGGTRISNVISGRSTDETLTQIIEAIADEYKPKQA